MRIKLKITNVKVDCILQPLSLSEPAELQRCVFADSLVTVSEGGRALGNFTFTVEFARKDQQPCMLLHAQSQGTIDQCPCGTTVTGKGKTNCSLSCSSSYLGV